MISLGIPDYNAVHEILTTLSNGSLRKAETVANEHKITGYRIQDKQIRIDIVEESK